MFGGGREAEGKGWEEGGEEEEGERKEEVGEGRGGVEA